MAKRRKVWVATNDDGGTALCGDECFAYATKKLATAPFIERLPGDVVLSREEVESLRYALEQVGQSTPRGSDDANRVSHWLALLRGRR